MYSNNDSIILYNSNKTVYYLDNIKSIIISGTQTKIFLFNTNNNNYSNFFFRKDNFTNLDNGIVIDKTFTNWNYTLGITGDNSYYIIDLKNLVNSHFTSTTYTNMINGFKFYDTVYRHISISTNGYIVFGYDGDIETNPSIINHFRKNRVSFIFNDLDLNINSHYPSSIEYELIDDNDGVSIYQKSILLIEYKNLYENKSIHNSAQVLLYLENSSPINKGKIKINYRIINSKRGIIGLSKKGVYSNMLDQKTDILEI